jgi:hypothetical protein
MAGRDVARGVGVAAVGSALLAAAIQVQAARERAYPAPDVEPDAVVLTSGAVRQLAGAHRALAADVYWIRAIQYYGGAKRRIAERPPVPEPPPLLVAVDVPPEYSQLYALLDITTTLDPLFEIAYRFGAIFLAEAYPNGAGSSELAVRLLEKGLRAQPDKWEYMEDIGFVYYWYEHDFRQASAWFEKASNVPGAPVWLKGLSATTLARGGDRESSRLMWQSIRDSSDVEWMRGTAERVLAQFDALDRIEEVQARLDDFARGSRSRPADWAAAVRAGVFPGIPVDPTGTPFDLTVEGQVRLSEGSPLFPLPVEPRTDPPR